MKTLFQLLDEFDGRTAASINDLAEQFRKIARRVLCGGHFLINDGTKIFPLDIEFYYFNEDQDANQELNDFRMYHKGNKKDIPYFPMFTLCPNESGIDVTFEHEEKGFRASFLIRKYRYEYVYPQKEENDIDKPRYLWEDMFGYHSLRGGGFSVKWVDDENLIEQEPIQDVRLNLKEDKGLQDTKPWRFYIK